MFLLKGLMTHCLLAIINLVPVGTLYLFDIQWRWKELHSFWNRHWKNCLISLTVELIKIFY